MEECANAGCTPVWDQVYKIIQETSSLRAFLYGTHVSC